MELKNRTAIITGSATNIGRAVALEYARLGCKVVINARRNRQAGEELCEQIKSSGGEALFVQADLSIPSDVTTLFQKTLAKFGTVDILINNAGTAKGKPFLETDRDYWVEAFDHNFFNAVLCSIEAGRIMKGAGTGKIINTSSIRGLEHVGRPGIMAYSAAKAALINFTKTLAKELAPNVQVNAVAPGFVLTSNYDTVSDTLKDEWIEGTLIKRWIGPAEMASPFVFLATNDAVTGEVLVVDGGFSLK